MVVAMIASGPKSMGSTQAMIHTEKTSALYPGWVSAADADVEAATSAVLARDLETLGTIMEASTMRMHATMMSATPPVRYWTPATVAAMDTVLSLRKQGVEAFYTMDAGPNVKVLCRAGDAQHVRQALEPHCERVDILGAGPDAQLL
jgi:diphosphomevalonate decarboxylase